MSLSPAEVQSTDTDAETKRDLPWVTIVWNDPVNLMTYVTHVLMELFGYSRDKATELMLQVHHEGRAVVSNGSREQMEADVARCHAKGLWATLSHDS
jgi:ATP-dependent Clp protease adaptor protein ClpS